MQIMINGQTRDVSSGTTVADLLTGLQIVPERVAVELNLQILNRGEYQLHSLREGDRVEIIGFVGGGGLC